MNKILFLVAGLAAGAAYFVARSQGASKPAAVEDLAHKLQDAWADHHTVA